MLALTIPDPTQTALFAALSAAARTVKVDPQTLAELWALAPGDLISVNGLNEIGFQILNSTIQPLSHEFVLPAANVAQLRARVHDFNREIVDIAKAEGARVFNLACYCKNVHENGVLAGTRMLTADYLGGFYTLNGYTPGAAGHALIANEILGLLNREFGATFPAIDIASSSGTAPCAIRSASVGPSSSSCSSARVPLDSSSP